LKVEILVAGLSVAAFAHGQVAPSAFKEAEALRLGIEYSNMKAGFPYGSDLRLSGLGVFATFQWKHNLGLEGEARFLRFNSYYGETEDAYLGGPHYAFLHSPRWRPYAAFKVGDVKITYPFQLGTCSCLALAPTGGLDYRVNKRWSLRGEYQYQFLPGSPNFTNEPQYGIKPNGFQTGISYRLF
jgi:opacity protein-like surface antigen